MKRWRVTFMIECLNSYCGRWTWPWRAICRRCVKEGWRWTGSEWYRDPQESMNTRVPGEYLPYERL